MTRDDIIRMAREAGCDVQEGYVAYCDIDDLCLLAALVAAAEREACAKVASSVYASDASNYPSHIAASIRARGKE